jgi:hypothetical protein
VKYNLEHAAGQEWLSVTRWSQKQMTKEALDKLLKALYEMQLVSRILPLEAYLSKWSVFPNNDV